MPINLMENKIYEIDYEGWIEEFKKIELFNDKKLQEDYIRKWLAILGRCDVESIRNFMDKNNRRLLVKELSEAPEVFQVPVIYANNTMYVHFKVSRINQLLEVHGIPENEIEKINLSEFLSLDRTIHWAQTRDKVDLKSTPILLVPMSIANYTCVVIDGNHRITDAIEKKAPFVRAVTLDSNYLVESNLFSTEFDKLLYVFQNEIVALALYAKDGVPIKEVFKKSYLCTGQMPYYIN